MKDDAGGGHSAEVERTRSRAGSVSFPERNYDADIMPPADLAQAHQVCYRIEIIIKSNVAIVLQILAV